FQLFLAYLGAGQLKRACGRGGKVDPVERYADVAEALGTIARRWREQFYCGVSLLVSGHQVPLGEARKLVKTRANYCGMLGDVWSMFGSSPADPGALHVSV